MRVALLFPATPFNVSVPAEIAALSKIYGKIVSTIAQEKLKKETRMSPASGFRIIPIVGYVAALLKEDGHKVKYYQEDHMRTKNSYEKLIKEISEYDAVFIPFSTTQYYSATNLIKTLKQLNKNIFIGVLGREATFLDEKVIKDMQCDVAIRGDGEFIIKELCNLISSGKDIRKCNGITFLSGKNVKRNHNAEPIDLGKLPKPDFSIIPSDIRKNANVSLNISRGCGFNCDYCYESAFWGKNIKYRPLNLAIDDIKEYFRWFPYDHVFFHDSTFTMNRKRTLDFAKMFKHEFPGKSYACNARGETLDKDVMNALRKSGCIELFMGIDSFSEKILKNVSRGGSLQTNLTAIKKANKIFPFVVCSTIIGLPGETYETATHAIRSAKKLINEGVFQVSSRLFVPYPGTPIYHNPKKYGVTILTQDFSRYDRYSYPPVIRLNTMNEFELYGMFSSFFGMATSEVAKRLGIDIKTMLESEQINVRTQNLYKTVYWVAGDENIEN